MEAKEAKRWVKSVVNQRKRLLRTLDSKVNPALCASICERIDRYLSANAYNGDKIYHFIRRHYSDILIIIPGNNGQSENLKKLNECAKKSLESRNSSPSNAAQLHLQLQHS